LRRFRDTSKILTALILGVSVVACSPKNEAHQSSHFDKIDIAERVNQWGYLRDQSNWAALEDTFVQDGQISISWFCGPHSGFVSRSKELEANKKNLLKHITAAPVIKVNNDRALSEASVTITVRVKTPMGEFDTTTSGRFLDRLIKRDGEWLISDRIGIYEKDRIDSVSMPTIPAKMYEAAEQYPDEIRFIALGLATVGASPSPLTVMDKTPRLETLLEEANAWLAGEHSDTANSMDCSASPK